MYLEVGIHLKVQNWWEKLARLYLDQNKTLTFIGLHRPERNNPICTSTTGQHETVLALVHDPAGVIANAECRREEDRLADIPCGSHLHWRHSPELFKPEKSVSEWPTELKSREMEKPKRPQKPCDPEFPTYLVLAG
jgi:hypothetical protein